MKEETGVRGRREGTGNLRVREEGEERWGDKRTCGEAATGKENSPQWASGRGLQEGAKGLSDSVYERNPLFATTAFPHPSKMVGEIDFSLSSKVWIPYTCVNRYMHMYVYIPTCIYEYISVSCTYAHMYDTHTHTHPTYM